MRCLKENYDVRQREEEGFRRWFVNDYFDIIVWYDKPDGSLIGFQVCFSRNKHEKAFTWEPGSTSSHFVSSSFLDLDLSPYATAILQGHAGDVPEDVVQRLRDEAGELDQELLDFIIEKINTYNSSENQQVLSAYQE